MSAQVEKVRGGSSGREEIRARFEEEGLHPSEWGNAPGDQYSWHSHSYHKVLYCVSGSIVFHTEDGASSWRPGTGWTWSRGRITRRRSDPTA